MEAAPPPSTVEVPSDALIDTVHQPAGQAQSTWPRTGLTEGRDGQRGSRVVGTLRIGRRSHRDQLLGQPGPPPAVGVGRG